jgi:hypothetical protein
MSWSEPCRANSSHCGYQEHQKYRESCHGCCSFPSVWLPKKHYPQIYYYWYKHLYDTNFSSLLSLLLQRACIRWHVMTRGCCRFDRDGTFARTGATNNSRRPPSYPSPYRDIKKKQIFLGSMSRPSMPQSWEKHRARVRTRIYVVYQDGLLFLD